MNEATIVNSTAPGVRLRVSQPAEFKLGRGEIHHLKDEIERAGRGEYGDPRHTTIVITFGENCTYLRMLPGIKPIPLKKTG